MDYKLLLLLPSLLIILLASASTAQAHAYAVISTHTSQPPTLDGIVNDEEWVDANFYRFSSGYGIMFNVYLEHDENYFYIAVEVQNDATEDSRDFLVMYFDEGDDGSHGSGSHDSTLTLGQEDLKQIDGAGNLLDGYLSVEWEKSPVEVDFDAAAAYYDGSWGFEFKIPYSGREGLVQDLSDLTVTTNDVVGFFFEFYDYAWEDIFAIRSPIDYGLSLASPSTWLDLGFDSDNDGLLDGEENAVGSNPFIKDTDNDGLTDNEEVRIYGTSPLKLDTDDDGLSDWDELTTCSTDPSVADTDNDGLNDGEEIELGTNPLKLDTDSDGLSDGREVTVHFTDPLASDSDGDGLSDGAEIEIGTNPLKVDSDGDGWGDSMDMWPLDAGMPNSIIVVSIALLLISLGIVIWWKWIRPRFREWEEIKLPSEYRMFESNKSYLIEEPRPARAFKVFTKFVEIGFSGLCISQIYPDELKSRYKLGNATVLWLTEQEVEGGISPLDLEMLQHEITEFVKGHRNSVVLLDGFEYLMTRNGFDSAFTFLQNVGDIISINRAKFIISIRSDALEPRHLALLERSIEVVKVKS